MSARRAEVQVGKAYLAIVAGRFPAELAAVGTLVDGVDPRVRKRRTFRAGGAGGDGEAAATVLQGLQDAERHSLVLARPKTGRTHQIRATLADLGYPLLGDKLYGGDPTCYLRFCGGGLTDDDHRRLGMARQALHAWQLSFQHPHGHRRVVTAPPPLDLTAAAAGCGLDLHSIRPPVADHREWAH